MEKLTWKAGWNGVPYEGNDWIVANTMIPSRKLTKKEIRELNCAVKKFAKEKNLNIKIGE